jgi:hypothetical protein
MPDTPSESVGSSEGSFLSVMSGVIDSMSQSPGAISIPVPQQQEEAPQEAPKETPVEETKQTESKPVKKGVDALLDDAPDQEQDQQKTEATEDAEEIPENIKDNPKAVAKWGEIRAEKKALEKKLAQAEAQLAEKSKLQDADPLRKEAEEYKQKYEELEKEAATWRIEKTSAYRTEITEPLLQIEDEVTEIAKKHDIDADKLLAAFNESDPASREKMLEELTEFMSQSSRYETFALNKKCLSVFKRAGELQANAQAAMKEIMEREQVMSQQSKTEAKAQEMRAIEANLEKIKKVAADFVAKDQSPEKFIEELKNEASETSFDDLSPEDKAFAVIASTSLPKVRKTIVALRKEIAKLRDEISGYGSAMPRSSTGQTGFQKASGDASFLESVGIK